MNENRCATCEFWNWTRVGTIGDTSHADCESEDVNGGVVGRVRARSTFGCVYWQEKEPPLRELLAEHLFFLWRDWLKSRMEYENISEGLSSLFFAEADKILAVVKDANRCHQP